MITSKKEFRAFAKKRDRAVFNLLGQAMLMSLDQVIVVMRRTTAFEDQTANLRASIGHRGPIKASDGPIGLRPRKQSDHVVKSGDSYTATIYVGMEYANAVAVKTGFHADALAAAPAIFGRNITSVSKLIQAKFS